MAKQTVNIGSAELSGDGESLRSAFSKINSNFNELYTSLDLSTGPTGPQGEAGPSGPEGPPGPAGIASTSSLINGSFTTILNGAGDLVTSGDVLPGTSNQFNLGSDLARWNTVYVNTLTIRQAIVTGDYDTDNYSRIRHLENTLYSNTAGAFVAYGFTSAYEQSTVIVNEDANVNQVIFLGDSGSNSNETLFGIAVADNSPYLLPTTGNETTWQKKLELSGKGNLYLNSGTVYVSSSSVYFNNIRLSVSTTTGISINGTPILESVSNHILPSADLTYDLGSTSSQWRSLYVGTSTVYFGGIPLRITQEGGITVNDQPVTGGSVQPYLELINTPLIIQPAVLGEPVTVTEEPSGINANFMVTITEGPTLDVGAIIVSNGGSGYTVGQRYRLWNYNIGGPDVASSIDFEVDTVGENGEILTIINAAFVGSASNVPGTYEFVPVELRASVFDQIGPGLTITRDYQQGIYNIEVEQEYDNNTYLSPLGTEWNSEGWGDLLQLGLRSYTTWRQALNNRVGNEIVASELVMHDIANDKYYKFDFHTWGGSNGGYSYTRTEVTDPNYFRKPHNAEAADIVVADDPEGSGVVIVRTDSTGIYNSAQEEGFSNATSPVGTTWNADGWDDLSDLTTRTYTSFNTAAGGYNSVLGKQFVMYVASTQTYYAIQFYEWATNGDNNFAYVRYEIDETKLNEGVKFADGTVLKSAEGLGRVKLTSPGNRRIEEVHGYKEVSVTSRVTNDYTGISARTTETNYEIFVERTPELDAILQPIWDLGGAEISISFDNVTFTPSFLSSIQAEEYWFYYNNYNSYIPQTQGNNVYIRITSGAEPAVWWDRADLPGGSQDFRGAVIDYHAWTGESTIVGTVHIVRDSGEDHISHQEVASGSTDGENDDLWLVQSEGQISYRRTDGEAKTLKVQWTAKVFYGSEFWD